MSWRSAAVLVSTFLAALGSVADAGAKPIKPIEQTPRRTVLVVHGEAEFAAAVRYFQRSGGRIVLRPYRYRQLVVGPRSRRPLRIVGMRGVRVGRLLFTGAQKVSFGRVTVGPVRGDALIEVYQSRDIVLHDLVVTARGTRSSSSILVSAARGVTIRRSNFMHCGDRARDFTNCVTLYRWSHRVLIEDNRFHDCLGCDFIHGRFGTHLTIRRNRFDRSLPCRMSAHRCGHQDLVQLFSGRHLRVAGNRFGVYKSGGAQLYLTNNVDYATIVNNFFAATDPRVPGYRVRMGIVVGSNASRRLPHYAKVINNTILSGAVRRDGYAGSIRMSSRYGSVPRWKRPIVANNVIALLETPARVCNGSQRFISNVVVQGKTCWGSELIGSPNLDGRGRPRPASTVIDGANRHYAPARDAIGRRRTGRPDIGAFEFKAR
jgi:hypothetical protein